MGYACPVCATPQRDGEHLAHHLAFTAMIHGDDHEAWLDEHAPGWGERDPEGLAAAVTPHAEATEYHEVFEDTTDRGRPDVDVDAHASGHGDGQRGASRPDATELDPETTAALEEARELTRELYEEAEGDASEGDDNGSDVGEDDVGEDDADDASDA